MPSYNPREDEAYFRYGEQKDEGQYYFNNYHSSSFHRYGPLSILIHLMMVCLFFFLVVAVLSLIGFLAEAAEDFPSTARKIMWLLIAVNVTAHVLIMLYDQPSWLCSLCSLATNGLYARLMARFPFVPSLTHPLVLATAAFTVVESILWLLVTRGYVADENISTPEAVTFILFLWVVPVGFLCSVVPDSEQLPGARDGGGGGRSAGSWSGTRVASPRFVVPGGGFDDAGNSDLPHPSSSASPYPPQGPFQPPPRNQSVLGRIVRFIKNPGDT